MMNLGRLQIFKKRQHYISFSAHLLYEKMKEGGYVATKIEDQKKKKQEDKITKIKLIPLEKEDDFLIEQESDFQITEGKDKEIVVCTKFNIGATAKFLKSQGFWKGEIFEKTVCSDYPKTHIHLIYKHDVFTRI